VIFLHFLYVFFCGQAQGYHAATPLPAHDKGSARWQNARMNLEQRVIIAVDRMPAFPRSVQRLLELTRDINVEPRAIVEVLEHDPVMAGRILRTVNSAFYGLSRKVSSMSHAVVLLGMNTVKNMALAVSAAGMLPRQNAAGFDTSEYLRHSLIVAGMARTIARHEGDADPGEAYIAGLLHDFGKVLFATNLPEEFHRALQLATRGELALHDAERREIGMAHPQAGAMLARKWQFPETLAEAIAAHHDAGPFTGTLRSLFLADQLTRCDEKGDPLPGRTPLPLPEGAGGRLGESWPEIVAALPERSRVIAEAQTFAS